MNRFEDIKRTKPGRKGDPRMNRAVGIRLANPGLSLLDALVAGGFVFSRSIERQTKKGGAVYDSDGVLLNQRRNQLSKRLWQATRKNLSGYGSEHSKDCLHLERNSKTLSAEDIHQNEESNLDTRINALPVQEMFPSNLKDNCQMSTAISRQDKQQADTVISQSKATRKNLLGYGSEHSKDCLHLERNSKTLSAEDIHQNEESNLGTRINALSVQKMFPSNLKDNWQMSTAISQQYKQQADTVISQSKVWKVKAYDELYGRKEQDDTNTDLVGLLKFLSKLPNDDLTDESTLEDIVKKDKGGCV
eukprot:CAMPEP_0185741000 /NCGR_PEP_ID=MMETSP1171-20130828/38725_1 /TAXON_ID=374046 /ORGANISM="Helicotheca tamensis, Strain CCMP826" /LENGTH=303 /DNA_ID=CAMNT_0028412937 /DNA_START=146 /DNA_END=1057 /DNA_ORIENTATION=-